PEPPEWTVGGGAVARADACAGDAACRVAAGDPARDAVAGQPAREPAEGHVTRLHCAVSSTPCQTRRPRTCSRSPQIPCLVLSEWSGCLGSRLRRRRLNVSVKK